MTKSLYLAAPLFTEAERAFNLRVRDILTPYFDVFLPQVDGALVYNLIDDGATPAVAKRTVFQNDVGAIEHADILLIVLDGRTVDEGAAFELGVAFALGKVCWAIKTDVRQLLSIGDNPMIEGAVSNYFRSVLELQQHLATTHSQGEHPLRTGIRL